MPVGCPRCDNKNVTKEKLKVGLLEVAKRKCGNCDTGFYFEEDVLALMSMVQEPKK